MAPGQDLGGARAIAALDVSLVANAGLLQGHVAEEAIGVDGCVVRIDGVEKKGAQIALVRHALEHAQPG